MASNTKQTIREGYNKLKKSFERIFKPKSKQPVPSLVLQPVRPNNLRGTGPY